MLTVLCGPHKGAMIKVEDDIQLISVAVQAYKRKDSVFQTVESFAVYRRVGSNLIFKDYEQMPKGKFIEEAIPIHTYLCN